MRENGRSLTQTVSSDGCGVFFAGAHSLITYNFRTPAIYSSGLHTLNVVLRPGTRTSYMRNTRQITVLRSLFKTLHPILESGLTPARRLLTGSQNQAPDAGGSSPNRTRPPATPAPLASPTASVAVNPKQPALERTITDEHLAVELENITRQISIHGHTAHTHPSRHASPQRGERHYSRDSLLALLEEAKVRIQVLETELELARGFDESIPMLTEEWQDAIPEQHD